MPRMAVVSAGTSRTRSVPRRPGKAVARKRAGGRAGITVDARRPYPVDRTMTGYFSGPSLGAGKA